MEIKSYRCKYRFSTLMTAAFGLILMLGVSLDFTGIKQRLDDSLVLVPRGPPQCPTVDIPRASLDFGGMEQRLDGGFVLIPRDP